MKIQALSKIKRASSLLTIAFLFAAAAFGQSNTGSITGVVTDPNGAVVPNATVTVTNQGTNEARTVQADGEGRYEVPGLSNGVYTIETTASGFQATSVKDLRLAVGEKARADVAMSLGGVDAVVTVADQTRTDTETSTIGDTIDIERIADNPVNGRDFTQLLATIQRVQESLNPSLYVDSVLLTMFDARLNLSRQVAADTREHFAERVFKTVIPRNIRLAEAPSFGKPIVVYDIASVGAQAYMAVARELLERDRALTMGTAAGESSAGPPRPTVGANESA